MHDPVALNDLHTYLTHFSEKHKEYCRQGIVCDEDLMVDLIKLDSKRKKAFLVGMPSIKQVREILVK